MRCLICLKDGSAIEKRPAENDYFKAWHLLAYSAKLQEAWSILNSANVSFHLITSRHNYLPTLRRVERLHWYPLQPSIPICKTLTDIHSK